MSLLSTKDLRERFSTLISAIWTILIPELMSFDSLCSIALCTLCSYYVYKIGYWLGAQSSTPDMASILSNHRVLQGSFYPREVRLYAQVLLAMSTGTLIWSISLSLKTLQHESPKLEDSAVSPKLPFSTPTSRWLNSKYTPLSGSFVAVSPRQPPSAIRAACISRIKKFTVLFCFCFAFLRRQHIGSTLIYHPVNSPFLLTRLHSAHLDAELDDDSQTHNLPEGVDIMRSPTRYNETVVPNIVHFVFGMDETFGGKPFAFAHYLSMYSGKRAATASH